MKDPAGKNEETWTPVRARSSSSQIVNQICDALFAGEISSGQFLGSEAELAEQFGVSRFPARDALRTLEALGVIEIRMGAEGGAFVAKGNPHLFARALAIQLQLVGLTYGEIFDAQKAVESFAAELAARQATEEDLALISDILDEMAGLVDQPDKFFNRSLSFHIAISKASQSRVLVAQLEMIGQLLVPEFKRFSNSQKDNVLQRHRELFEHIKNGEGDKARAHVCDHIDAVRAHFSKADLNRRAAVEKK